ncbi:unnamed protein product [Candida verbasci]|uniref:Autophagy-related protein 3 n=1 Tax=Candida verbasci TaxID=1227364 RepID=A0A9W4XAU2_9ASCO|nr:unnamed protein product [Candida verbasci]
MSIRSKLSSLREYLTPINNNSNFLTTGQISPQEFEQAGDFLVSKFPTWQWSAPTSKANLKTFLPPDKQFLITKHVPSYQRANNYLGKLSEEGDEEEEEEEVDEDGWVKSKQIRKVKEDDAKEIETEEGFNDIDELIDNNAEGEEFEENEDYDDLGCNKHLRKYDLYITYSTSYRVPKLYLVGYDSNGIPLLPNQMFEDINSDYKDKTATIENLPVSSNTMSVSIHPCKHSSVMKVLMKHSKLKNEGNEDEENNGMRVDQYLIIFLKFISSVTPGIEYDYTMEAL